MTHYKQSTDSNFNRRTLLSLSTLAAAMAAAGCSSLGQSSASNAVPQLVTPQEVAALKDDVKENLAIPLSGDEPLIEVLRPAIKDGKVSSPVAIEVRFKPASGRAIDTESFKLYYGALKLDVTSRLLKTVKVSQDGFSIDKIDIPSGSHRLVMRVADSNGSTGLREIKFTVEG